MWKEVSTESGSDRVAQTSICDSAIFLTKVRDATAIATGDPVATALGTDFMMTARPLDSLRKF